MIDSPEPLKVKVFRMEEPRPPVAPVRLNYELCASILLPLALPFLPPFLRGTFGVFSLLMKESRKVNHAPRT
jgi:hypothetical protein